MARVHLDDIETLTMEEHNGAIVKVVRRLLVTELTSYTREEGGAHRVLQEALNHSDMPQHGYGLTSILGVNNNDLSHLRLNGRIPKMLKDKAAATVELIYESVLSGGTNQLLWFNTGALNGNPLNVLYGKHKASLVSRKTNQYKENGVGPYLPIFVQHTYPRAPGENLPGVTKTQNGEIEIMDPQNNYKFGGYLDTNFPTVVSDLMLGSVNSVIWVGKIPFYWLCTEVEYEMVKVGRYLFRFEFQGNPDLWKPEVAFIDERTGRPPPNLVQGTGIKKLAYYRPLNYNLLFKSSFEGWLPIV